MRNIKLTGREASLVRVMGFGEPMLGAEIHENTQMDIDDVLDTLNSLMSAGFVESIPFYNEVPLAEMPGTAFEINPAYVGELRRALYSR